MFVLPDYTSVWRTKLDKKTLIVWGTAWLAAMWTVAYISLQWYSADARNSKRIQDLNNIAWSINIKTTMWTPLESFVVRDEQYEWKNVYVWWKKLVWWEDYFVWTPNYTALWIKQSDFQDPNGSEYLIWVTTMKWWAFEILASIENWDGNNSVKITWTYFWNNLEFLKKWKDYEIIWDNIIKINSKHINRIYRGDIIGWNKVINISSDWLDITFENKFDKKIILLKADSKWLIYVWWNPIVNNDIY